MSFERTIILDWDGTLATVIPDGFLTRARLANRAEELHYVTLPMNHDGRTGKFVLVLRPFLLELVLHLSAEYNLALWSYGVPDYIDLCLKKTGLHKIFSGPNVITRADMSSWNTPYKDLYRLKEHLGIRLRETVIVDDSHFSFGVLNPFNCVDIPTWTPEVLTDTALRALPTMINQRFEALARLDEAELERRREEILRSMR